MADEVKGRWITVRGAHIFLKDGETPDFSRNRGLQKTIKEDKKRKDGESYAQWKVRVTRDFIEKTVKEINDYNAKQRDPNDPEVGFTNTDLQGMVEAFNMENGFDDDFRVIDEIRARTGMGGTEEDREFYERANKRNKEYWDLQKNNARPMDNKNRRKK